MQTEALRQVEDVSTSIQENNTILKKEWWKMFKTKLSKNIYKGRTKAAKRKHLEQVGRQHRALKTLLDNQLGCWKLTFELIAG